MANEAMKAYLTLIPKLQSGATASVNSQLSKVDTSSSGKSIGSKLGGSIAAGLAAVGIGAAIGSALSAALEQYAQYEQLVGGVETLFKGSADAVMQYADSAYKTAGLSANEYMETVTSFSASLLQSLGGDTAKAAQYADIAITDMSDNANKMGTDMESIQNAYQGFAKQNYTMLDNLKLGYGGTKSEMERLIADANALREAQGLNADLTIDSYADVVEAIHTVQTEMGITGTTALEAATTIEGSVNSAKAAWANFVTGLGNTNADMDALTGQLVNSVITAANNILPRLSTIISSAGNALATAIPALLPQLTQAVLGTLPQLINAVVQLTVGLMQALPVVIQQFVDALPVIIDAISTALIENSPALLVASIEMFGALLEAAIQIAPQLIAMIPEIVMGIVSELWSHRGDIAEAGLNMIKGLGDGIANAKDWVIEKIRELCTNALDTVKSFFGISSPSKVMKQQGRYIMQGFALGIADSSALAQNAMNKAIASVGAAEINASASVFGSNISTGRTTNIYINGARINDDSALEDAAYRFLTELNHLATTEGVA